MTGLRYSDDIANRTAESVRSMFIEFVSEHRGYGDDLPRRADDLALAIFPLIRDAVNGALVRQEDED